MKRARIHVYLGTVELPKRNLSDQQTAHDIVEIDIGDNEDVKELEMHEQKGVYRTVMETQEQANARAARVSSMRGFVEDIGGTFTGNTSPEPKEKHVRMRELTSYRYRLVTLEVAGETVDVEPQYGAAELTAPVDAEVIEED